MEQDNTKELQIPDEYLSDYSPSPIKNNPVDAGDGLSATFIFGTDTYLFGCHCLPAPVSSWQKEMLEVAPRYVGSIFKPALLWKNGIEGNYRLTNNDSGCFDAKDGYLSLPCIARFWNEPINPLDNESDLILLCFLYFSDYPIEGFTRRDIEEATDGLRISAAELINNT